MHLQTKLASNFLLILVSICFLTIAGSAQRPGPQSANRKTFLGFDRNDYPGDTALRQLRGHFAFAGYWLNRAPGASVNTWEGKRAKIQNTGFGFLVLFNGRLYKQLKASGDARKLGLTDGADAVSAARREGFPRDTVIFLDQEEGGRMLPEQNAYIFAWAETVNAAGFRAGVYCSGIPFQESRDVSIVTAEDIQRKKGNRPIRFFVSNDQCPPSPGCVTPPNAPAPAESGVPFAEVWQYAQSPRRPEMTGRCRRTYSPDGNCYAPGMGAASGIFIDIDSSTSSDPSHGRTH